MKKTNLLQTFVKRYFIWILFSVTILMSIFFRFYHLSQLPPGLHPDEAANGLDIFRILENRDFRVIYNTNGPREALFFYLQAVFVAFMGNTILALRVAPAFFGVIATVVMFFAAKSWFNRRTALIATFLFAINPWVVTISRDGFRASLVPFFIALVMWFAARAYKNGKITDYILAGLTLGLGFYTYTAFMMIFVAILMGLIYMFVTRRGWLRQNWQKIAISIVVFIITLIPLVVTTIKDPSASTARVGGTSFLNKELNGGKPIQTLADSFAKTALQYNFKADENNRHNYDGAPLLNTFVGIMFLVGLILCLHYFLRPNYGMLVIIFVAMLLPAVLTAEGLPHGLRSIGTAVPVLMMASLGTNYLLKIWYRTFPINSIARSVGLVIVCLLLGLSLVQAYRQYFIAWAQDPQTYSAYSEESVSIAKYLIENKQNSRKNIVFMGGYEANPIEYLTHKKVEYKLVDEMGLANLPLQNGPKLIIIPEGNQATKAAEIVRAKFPQAKIVEIKSASSGEVLFYVFEVNP